MPTKASDIPELLDLQQQVTAILAQFADADQSEGVLTRYFALRDACDKEVWREVIGVLAQGREQSRPLTVLQSKRAQAIGNP